MRVTVAYNLRREDSEAQAELLTQEDVDRLEGLLRELGHEVTAVEVSGALDRMVDRLVASRPDLIFNVAEGASGENREASYPAIFELLGLPHTGGGAGLLLVDLDKRLTEKILSLRGIRVPRGGMVTHRSPDIPDNLHYPLLIKPNYEGSGKGIHQDSVVKNPEEANDLVRKLLPDYPQGLDVEEYIAGRELTVPFLEAWPGGLLEIVEHTFSGSGYPIYDYEMKKNGEGQGHVTTVCPPTLSGRERQAVLELASKVFRFMPCPDLGRVDLRLREDETPFVMEINPLPGLQRQASLMTAARAVGLEDRGVIERIVRSAAQRYKLDLGTAAYSIGRSSTERPDCRSVGVHIGRFPQGKWNAITDVNGVRVGHVTHILDGVALPGDPEQTGSVRTGVTAIVPSFGDLFNNHLAAGGFVLNGIGEMSGLTQTMEWGWLETPVLLTNTMSVGPVHTGIVRDMIERHPELGRKVDVIIPVVGETNDAFLNDVRIPSNTPEDARAAIAAAQDGPVEQGSVGGGTGMISFDFAGGIGTSSRVLPKGMGGYTVGVLVQSNFGKMRNLTVDGAVVGRELDAIYPLQGRRGITYGSVIVVVATDAPLIPAQLNQLSKRAALGLGRIGSYAATTSGEIVFSFSTGNRASREAKESAPVLHVSYVTDRIQNLLYEAVVEATEEAVLNAIVCSKGMTGREEHHAPPLPVEMVLEILSRGHRGGRRPLPRGRGAAPNLPGRKGEPLPGETA